MTDFLEQVIAERRADVAAEKARLSEEELLAQANANRPRDPSGVSLFPFMRNRHPTRSFHPALERRRREGRLAVIAEVKRHSPALGALSANLDPVALALAYVEAGASAISVLTEPRHWGGSLEDLVAVREAVDVPVLCKDVIVDEYQLVQARAAGADAVLLIAEALDDAALHRLIARAQRIGLEPLVEAHEPVAFGRAVASGARVVGVNARNLRRPSEIDIGRARQLQSFARPEQVLVAESGITSVDDARLLPARVDAVLIGTALVTAVDPAPLVRGVAGIRRTVHA